MDILVVYLLVYLVSLVINVFLIRRLNATQGAAPTKDCIAFWLMGPISACLMFTMVMFDLSSKYRFSSRFTGWIKNGCEALFLSKDDKK